jgi:hypothetical protein
MKIINLLGGAALLALAQQASAASDSIFSGTTTLGASVSDPSLSVTLDTTLNVGGPYQNFPPNSTGDGINGGNSTSRTFDGVNGSVMAACESSTFVNGTADQFQGEATFLFITNNSTSQSGSFTISEAITQTLGAVGDADTIAGSGFVEIGGAQIHSQFNSELRGDGMFFTSVDGTNLTGGEVSPGLFQASGGFTDTLGVGQTIEIEFYTAGITQATSTPAPEPATVLATAAGLLAIRRRKRAV